MTLIRNDLMLILLVATTTILFSKLTIHCGFMMVQALEIPIELMRDEANLLNTAEYEERQEQQQHHHQQHHHQQQQQQQHVHKYPVTPDISVEIPPPNLLEEDNERNMLETSMQQHNHNEDDAVTADIVASALLERHGGHAINNNKPKEQHAKQKEHIDNEQAHEEQDGRFLPKWLELQNEPEQQQEQQQHHHEQQDQHQPQKQQQQQQPSAKLNRLCSIEITQQILGNCQPIGPIGSACLADEYVDVFNAACM